MAQKGLGFVQYDNARSILEYFTNFIKIKILVKLSIDGLRMASDSGYSYGGRSHANCLILKDFAGFIHHLHFLLGVAVIQKRIDMRQRIHVDLMRVNFNAVGNAFSFLHHLLNGILSRAGHRLIYNRRRCRDRGGGGSATSPSAAADAHHRNHRYKQHRKYGFVGRTRESLLFPCKH